MSGASTVVEEGFFGLDFEDLEAERGEALRSQTVARVASSGSWPSCVMMAFL